MPVDIPLTGGGKRSANVQHWKRKGVEEGAGTSCKSLSLDLCAYAGPVLQCRIVCLCPNCRSLLAEHLPRERDDLNDGQPDRGRRG